MVRQARILAATALVGAVVIGGVIVSAQRRGAGPAGPQAGLALRALDLTDAQREQVRQLTQQHRAETQPLLDRVRAAREAHRQAAQAIPFSESQIRATSQALADVETEVAVERARLQSDIHALLTPEQQGRLQTMRAERDARMKQRMGRLQQRGQRRPRPQA